MFEYSVNYHARAKHIRIKVSSLGRVHVVAPSGASANDVRRFVGKNVAWVNGAITKLKDERLSDSNLGLQPPQRIHLKALLKKYELSYFPRIKKIEITENETVLSVFADTEEERLALLRVWLQKKAKQYLVPWLYETALTHKICFNKVSIRGQKTRWGSCSSKKNINLNRHLLFVEPALVNYLMVHELSHILHLNHSNKFWAEVARCEPHYLLLDGQLNQAHKTIPLWTNCSEIHANSSFLR